MADDGLQRLAQEIRSEHANHISGLDEWKQHSRYVTKGGLRESYSRLRGLICGHMLASGWVIPSGIELALAVNTYAVTEFQINLPELYPRNVGLFRRRRP